VDDGSGNKYSDIFDKIKKEGCIVLKHLVNFGKGNALKTGIKYITDIGENEGIITADSDGQHLPEDIIKIASGIKNNKDCVILGSRHFKGKIPIKSLIGNTITRKIFYFTTGYKIFDTQTGLRGFSKEMFNWLIEVEGSRFEYEMNILLEAEKKGYKFYEIEIETVYHKKHSTHFRAVEDSIKVYLPIFKFSISSLISSIIDYTLLFLIEYLSNKLLLSVIISRLFSSLFNYSVNRIFVFSKGDSIKNSLIKYFGLVIIVLILNYNLLLVYFEILNLPLVVSKVLTELTIFVFSFWVQKRFVFKNRRKLKNISK
ncbi:MAG: bifunctional glycosyltransferase family 2/GtrA family protein, partial [Clostridiales bacterium]